MKARIRALERGFSYEETRFNPSVDPLPIDIPRNVTHHAMCDELEINVEDLERILKKFVGKEPWHLTLCGGPRYNTTLTGADRLTARGMESRIKVTHVLVDE